ncbi:MAG TPA: GTPase domain-containing protein [Thermoanaerobaculales bacterium]|nr:GTPase domain-containing protein [Thermoanaerobaculales bacterium]
MVFFNYALRKLNAKIVYYGPGLCGKTTNLQWIHDHFEGGQRGKMISLSTEGDRTIFFDLLPLEIGAIRGMDVTLQLYTVPGQVHYNSTRQLVLRGADGVVFVADSQSTMRGSNVDSLRNLEENLSLQGVALAEFPHVLQFNKRDLGDLISVDELDAELNRSSVPFFEAVATEGVGVQETLEGIVKLVMRNLRERYEPVVAAGIAGPDIGPAPLDVEVPVVPIRAAAPPIAARVPPPPPLQPRRPLATPMPAGRAVYTAASRAGLQDDVPTRVYPEGRQPAAEPTAPGGFWEDDDSRPAGRERPLEPPPPAAKAREDFGFAMPFADLESTTDVGRALETEPAPPPVEPPLEEYRHAGDELERVAAALQAAPASPFEVGDLTPEPMTADSVFGAAAPPAERVAEAAEAIDRPPSWPARLRGTVDDLVASVLGQRPVRGATTEAPSPSEVPELRDELEAELAGLAAAPPAPGTEAEQVAADLDWWEPVEPGKSAEEEVVLVEGSGREPEAAEPAAPRQAAEGWFAEPVTDGAREPIEEPGGPFGEDAISYHDAEVQQLVAEHERFLADERVDVSPPALAERDWYEAHTAETLEAEGEPAASVEPLPAVRPETVWAVEPPAAPPAGAAESSRELAARHGLITLGEGDPFGDVVDDQPTPVRREIEPQVAMTPPPSFTSLVRADDNQLHLRLHGTGAIAESGQVRALDIEVPVPGPWVGNRRVTLQLRLTLSPVAEDDDGGSVGAP